MLMYMTNSEIENLTIFAYVIIGIISFILLIWFIVRLNQIERELRNIRFYFDNETRKRGEIPPSSVRYKVRLQRTGRIYFYNQREFDRFKKNEAHYEVMETTDTFQ